MARQTGRLGLGEKGLDPGAGSAVIAAHHVRVDAAIDDCPVFRRPRGFGSARRSRQRRLRLFGAEALGHHRGERVAGMQLRARVTPAQLSGDRLARRERRQQRLRFGDLGHFRRRRKAFERGREDGVGIQAARPVD